jgi:3-mercaptopyruvate sulfurtransferase SseA
MARMRKAFHGKLVSTDWVAEHLDDPDVRIVESDEDVLLYDTGHIPGAVKIDWHATCRTRCSATTWTPSTSPR